MKSQRLEGFVLVVIVVVVGVAAGWASFSHVKQWTMDNSPAGTPELFGWVNACISDLVPVASLLVVRILRKQGRSIVFPMVMFISGVSLSLAAQLAVAKPGPSGWLLSAVPALAFMGLTKMVLSVGMTSSDVKRKPTRKQPSTPEVHSQPVSDVPAEVPRKPSRRKVEVPATNGSTSEPASSNGNSKRKRISPEEMRTLIAELEAQHPGITKKEMAGRLGVSDRRIRQVLSEANEIAAV